MVGLPAAALSCAHRRRDRATARQRDRATARPRDRAPFSLRVVAVAVQDDELEVHRALKAGFPRPCMRLQVHRFVSWLGQVLGWPLTSLGRA